jgi:hypothetical protein
LIVKVAFEIKSITVDVFLIPELEIISTLSPIFKIFAFEVVIS